MLQSNRLCTRVVEFNKSAREKTNPENEKDVESVGHETEVIDIKLTVQSVRIQTTAVHNTASDH